jgi:cytochrome b561
MLVINGRIYLTVLIGLYLFHIGQFLFYRTVPRGNDNSSHHNSSLHHSIITVVVITTVRIAIVVITTVVITTVVFNTVDQHQCQCANGYLLVLLLQLPTAPSQHHTRESESLAIAQMMLSLAPVPIQHQPTSMLHNEWKSVVQVIANLFSYY